MSGMLVYALVSPSRTTPGTAGVRGERLKRLSLRGVDAIVGPAAVAPRPSRAAIRRYDAVIRRLAERYPSVLPARYGTHFDSIDALEHVVGSRRSELRAALARVRNRVQMTVRIFRAYEPRVRRPVPKARTGAQYLRARAAAARVPELEALRPAVQRWVKAERVERSTSARLAASVYHLISRASATAYHRALERAAEDAAITTIVSGPWPPYAFADVDSGW